MIRANELRLGNWLDLARTSGISGTYGQVRTIIGKYHHFDITIQSDVDDWLGGIPLTSLDPIPLTEEWLVKFGFDSKDPVVASNSDSDSFYLSDTKVKYVHQFQNLIFALTGKELTLTQPTQQ